MNRLASAFAACGLLGSAAVVAAPVTYTFSATGFTEIRNGITATDAERLFEPGDTTTGSFVYDAAVAASGPGPLVGTIYPGALSALSGTIAGLGFADASGFAVASNDGFDPTPLDSADPLVDLLVLTAQPIVPAPTAGLGDQASDDSLVFDLVNVRLLWVETGTDFLDADVLPGSLPPAAGLAARLILDYRETTGSGILHAVLSDAVTVTAVPLPPTLALLVPGLLVAAARARRRAPPRG